MIDTTRLHAPEHARPVAGDFVLYWMQGVALRAHHNFALNFAVEQANELGLPVLVYHGLRPDYPWASDRIHAFILQSVADLERDFEERGIQYGFFLEREKGNGKEKADSSPLLALARRAALVVTDFFPTFIVPGQSQRLREKIGAPLVAVDSATVVPMAHHGRAYSSARAIRPHLLELLPHFLHPVGDLEPRVRRTVEVPFEPLRLGNGERGHTDLLAALPIDHSVPPSRGIRGGTRAGRARLERFLKHGLPNYIDGRNDPNLEVTSGMSPYLHFGNLSIQEVLLRAREAGPAEQFGKFLDEALTWRELAHNFAYHDARHRTIAAIPAWARKELDDHSEDPRPALYSPGQLEGAETHDELWNAAQRSYLREGTMHNYMRMLWGKSVLGWTRNYRDALRILEHLNNKYALDGRDPNSYGGMHWIFGKFDRPFYRRPVYGTVRYLSLKAAAGKFDVPAYVKRWS